MSTGKPTEKKLTKKLKKLMEQPEWWFHRLPDAAVCRGRIPKQPADYMIMYMGILALVEAKECEKKATGKSNTIPVSRLTQLPKMRRFAMAGGRAFFIISHPGEWSWRLIHLDQVNEHRKGAAIMLDPFPEMKTIEELFDAVEKSLRTTG